MVCSHFIKDPSLAYGHQNQLSTEHDLLFSIHSHRPQPQFPYDVGKDFLLLYIRFYLAGFYKSESCQLPFHRRQETFLHAHCIADAN